jgi:cell division protein ZapA
MDQIDVRILDRDYRLAVASEDKERLIDAARAVDERMRAVRDAGRVTGTDRIAVMAALQLADELVELRAAGHSGSSAEANKRVRRMSEVIDDALKRQESLF